MPASSNFCLPASVSLQPVVSTGDEFLDEFLGDDASLDVDGAMPDIKVMDSGINMTGNEVSAE